MNLVALARRGLIEPCINAEQRPFVIPAKPAGGREPESSICGQSLDAGFRRYDAQEELSAFTHYASFNNEILVSDN
ncbi:MAG: hypothetical protein ACREVH_02280 [Gammaproteobacteria bacterium]